MIDVESEQNIEVLRALSKDLCHNLKVARIKSLALFVILILFIAGTLFALQTGEDRFRKKLLNEGIVLLEDFEDISLYLNAGYKTFIALPEDRAR